jgi:hypothetical protein
MRENNNYHVRRTGNPEFHRAIGGRPQVGDIVQEIPQYSKSSMIWGMTAKYGAWFERAMLDEPPCKSAQGDGEENERQ